MSLLYGDGVEQAVYFATFRQEIYHLNVAPALILKWIKVCKATVVFAWVKH